MKSWLCCFGMVAVAMGLSTACGDDSPSPGTGGAGGSGATGGTGGSSGTGGTGGDDGGGGDRGKATTVECTTVYENEKINYTGTAAPVYKCDGMKSTKYPDGPNACRNDSDCTIIAIGVRDHVRQCAVGCQQSPINCPAEAACNTTCVKEATSTKVMQPGLSDACGKCYTDISVCSRIFCLSECVADADAIACVKCQFSYGCRVPFEQCSGLDRQD
jgi:hypothetical protein